MRGCQNKNRNKIHTKCHLKIIHIHILYHKNQFTIVLCVNFYEIEEWNRTKRKKHTEMELLFNYLVIQSGVSFGWVWGDTTLNASHISNNVCWNIYLIIIISHMDTLFLVFFCYFISTTRRPFHMFFLSHSITHRDDLFFWYWNSFLIIKKYMRRRQLC